MNKEDLHEKSEEQVIREVAEEEGMTYEEVKSMWDVFKDNAIKLNSIKKKKQVTDKNRKKNKKKIAKKSRKRNR